MTKTFQIARGVAVNWIALATSMLVMFFLSPFVVHHLGNIAFGVWTLVVAIGSYMALLDLGLRGAVMRFVSRDYVRGDHGGASRAVSAALVLRLLFALAIMTVSLLLAYLAPHVFKIPDAMVREAQIAVLVTGLSVASSLIGGVFGGVLAALHRFDLMSGVTIAQTLFRAGGVVMLLRAGYGIVALAIWELVASVFAAMTLIWLARRTYPQLQLRAGMPERSLLHEYWSYSSWVVAAQVGLQLIYYSDNLVVGAFVSAAAVTFYAIGGGLIEYLRNIVSSLTSTFTPLASSFEAGGEQHRLRSLLINGTRAAFVIALPILWALFFRGKTFITLWMGPQYAVISGRVLQILVLAQFVAVGNYAGGGMMYGLSKHRVAAFWAAGEAVANLVLSIALVRHVGIYGVAFGTLVPSVFVSLFLRPQYYCRQTGLPLRQYFWESWIKPHLGALPYAVACYLTSRYWHAQSMSVFFLQVAAIFPVFALGMLVMFWTSIRNRLAEQNNLPASLAWMVKSRKPDLANLR